MAFLFSKQTSPMAQKKPPKNAKKLGTISIDSPKVNETSKEEKGLLDEANLALKKGDLKQCALTLENLSKIAPDSKKPLYLSRAASLIKHIDINRSHELAMQATRMAPHLASPWMVLSDIYWIRKKRPESIEMALRALKNNPQPQELVELGRHLSAMGRDEEAIEAVRLGYKNSKESIVLASYTLRVALKCADWQLSEAIIHKLKEFYKTTKNYDAGETPRTHLLWCEDESINIPVIANFAKKNYAEKAALFQPTKLIHKEKIRIGYLSSDFREHATSLLFLGILRYHNKERFELYAYCTSYDDGSALRRDVLSRFNVAKTLARLDDRVAAEVIHKDNIDILVDLNGLTEGSRLGIFAYRPAPIQISYLGFPGTAGGRFIDYIVADDYTIPASKENLYPEKIIRIPPTYQINDYQARFLPPAPKRKLTGLPDNALVLGMFNNINKVGPVVWDTWMQILKKTSNAVLWILDPGPVAQKNLLKSAISLGVTSERIIFAKKLRQEDHLARLQHCALILDPWPYGGHTTTGDALFAGIPIVCLEGANFASRVCGGLLKACGLDALIAPSIESYIDKVTELLSNLNNLVELKKRLIINRRNLGAFNTRMRTLQLEAAYEEALKQKIEERPINHIRVQVKNNK